MDLPNYKRGDKVRVISNDYKDGQPFHCFNVGDVLTVKNIDMAKLGFIKCANSAGLLQYLMLEHIEPLNLDRIRKAAEK